jgi:PAS domain S-box-containing protein
MIIHSHCDLDRDEHLTMLTAIADNLDLSIMITEADAANPRILYVNQRFTRLTGYTSREVIGQTPRLLQGKATDRGVLDAARTHLITDTPFHGQAINYTKAGSPFPMEWDVLPIHDPDGLPRFYIGLQRRGQDEGAGRNPRTAAFERWRRGGEGSVNSEQ